MNLTACSQNVLRATHEKIRVGGNGSVDVESESHALFVFRYVDLTINRFFQADARALAAEMNSWFLA